jgi:UDP:flavonoid glycosyltransferase YjiC (YdhE family)
MRVLFVSLASVGHTYPSIPLAVAARAAGHEVHFAAGEHVHEPLAANGLRPFRPADSFYEVYAEDLEPELTRLRPDLVVAGWGVPGAAVAARRAGIPWLWHGFGRMFPAGIGMERPTGGLHLDICPPSLQDEGFLATEERIPMRPVLFSTPAEPTTWAGADPLVYVTLGTAFGTPELLRTIIAGVAPLAARVLVATGRVGVEQLGDLPDNVRARPWVAQAAVLPHVDVVVHHGGSGTTLGALTVGAPQLVLPQGADQFANADALVAAGAALCLTEPTSAAVAESVRTLSARDGSARAAARLLAAEIAAMPAPGAVVPELARAARG